MRRRWGTPAGLAVLSMAASAAGLAVWPWLGEVAGDTAVEPAPTLTSYIVVPHPGDEFQAWSLLDGDDSTYKVFILATHGEESPGCQAKRSCEAAALASTVGFVHDMAAADPTLPQDLTARGATDPLPVPAGDICRYDGPDRCISDTTARLWVDEEGRGAVVAFNLGHGDLTRREVAWAVRTVRAHRKAWGLELLPNGDVIGASFSNLTYKCVRHADPDHRAVHEALYDVDLGMSDQIAPTCPDDPEATRHEVVLDESTDVAFGRDSKRGAHEEHYGWLTGRPAVVDRQGQQRPFHTQQHFWMR